MEGTVPPGDDPPFPLFRELLAWVLECDFNRVERVDRVEVRGEDFGRKESVEGIVLTRLTRLTGLKILILL